MNPFLFSTVATPIVAAPAAPRIASRTKPGTASRTAPVIASRAAPRPGARRYAGGLALVAGLGLAAAGGAAPAVDANTASAAQLESVRGIGPKTAADIVGERDRGGPFHSYGDLAGRVRGLGSRRLQRLREAGLALDGAAPAGPRVIVNTPPAVRRAPSSTKARPSAKARPGRTGRPEPR
ncbi:hypothetical protein GCM10023144_20530 [Pigmentiphaga soli]|uniref:Helix-hairpin-helix domain-containing protein n=1 Tax=Pigmentiphaga soli TaxID=1007095 RepID=A0ABP8GYG1_9BURK